ncbi:MAG: hypothetical protein JO013_10300 [Alphaproteobacteria bacterium]|nr:hypothetical protein [Alphaproteobacteria bacterium]
MPGSTIGQLRVILGLETAEFEKKADHATESMHRFEGATELAKHALEAFGVVMAAQEVMEFTKEAFEYAASLENVARQLGTNVEQYQVLTRTAKEHGVEQAKLEAGMKKLGITLGDAKRGSAEAIKAFAAIGISKDQLDSFHDAGDALPYVAEGLKNSGDAAVEASKGKRLFGKSVGDLIPLLNLGKEGMDEATESARKHGLITEEQAEKAHRAHVAIEDFATSLKTKLAIAVLDNTSDVKGLVDVFEDLLGTLETTMQELKAIGAYGPGVFLRLKEGLVMAGVGSGLVPYSTLLQTQLELRGAKVGEKAFQYESDMGAAAKSVEGMRKEAELFRRQAHSAAEAMGYYKPGTTVAQKQQILQMPEVRAALDKTKSLLADAASLATREKEERERRAAGDVDQDLEKKKKEKTVKPGDEIEAARRADLLAAAQGYTGANEHTKIGKSTLGELFKGAGITIDPEKLAWCAAFLNAVLFSKGYPMATDAAGHPTLSASSFLKYGSATNDPKPGDIVVLDLHGKHKADHVAFFAGFDAKGNVKYTGGNQSAPGSHGDGVTVNTHTAARSKVLSFRRVPDAADAIGQVEDQHAKALREEHDRDQQLRTLDEEILREKLAQTHDLHERTVLSGQILDLEREQQKKDNQLAVELEPGRAAEIQAKDEKQQQLYLEKKATLRLQESYAVKQEAMQAAEDELQAHRDRLEKERQLATTAEDRRRVELEILDLAYAEKRQRLQDIIDDERTSTRKRQAARDALANLNGAYGTDREIVLRGTRSPLEELSAGIPNTAAKMNEALEEVVAGGIRDMNDGLAETALAWLKIGGTAGQAIKQILAGILRLYMAMEVERPAANWLQKLFHGGSSILQAFKFGQDGAGFGGGGDGGGDGGGYVPFDSDLPGFASGGSFLVGGMAGIDKNVMSINDQPVAKVMQGERVSISRTNDRGPAGGNTYNFKGNLMTPEWWDQIHAGDDAAAVRGAAGGAFLGREQLVRRARRRMGRY